MSAAYTPGPWISRGEVRPVGDENNTSMLWCGGVEPEGDKFRGSIAHIQSCDHVRGCITREEAAANARLIAALPDLVEALKYAVEQLKAYKTTRVGIHHAAIERGYAALAKAGVQ